MHLHDICFPFLLICCYFAITKRVKVQYNGITDGNEISPCSSDEMESNMKPLEDMLLAEPELSRIGRQDRSLTVSYI